MAGNALSLANVNPTSQPAGKLPKSIAFLIQASRRLKTYLLEENWTILGKLPGTKIGLYVLKACALLRLLHHWTCPFRVKEPKRPKPGDNVTFNLSMNQTSKQVWHTVNGSGFGSEGEEKLRFVCVKYLETKKE